jgi:prepilin-type N-terminal cleavage/methylation domain-containing protein
MRRRAFSLVELSLVLLILAVAAAAAALRVRAPLERAGRQAASGAMAGFDLLVRQAAVNQDRSLRLRFHLGTGEIERIDVADGRPAGAVLRLPPGCSVARLIVRGQEASAGSAEVRCSRAGLTPSYAVEIESEAGWRQWLVFCGLTGQRIEVADDGQAREVLHVADAAAKGPDAG